MKNTATTESPASVEPEWVRAEKYFEMTGTPVETIRHYRKKGIWLVGKHLATVQNRLHVNIKEADAWIKEQALRRHRA
ncbi:excisionase [Delftia sp. NA_296.1]|uniref:excisionase n=1 Tax=Delftia sp. NA_296.1 TaxID=3415648 RepID=UPI004045833E